MSDFWTFTLSGAIVSWVPLVIGFVWHSKVMKRHIDSVTKDQTRAITRLTEAQTEELQGKDRPV
jgi:hypothetical protein